MKKFLWILLILSSLLLTIYLVGYWALFFMFPNAIFFLTGFIILDFLIIYSGITLFKWNKFNRNIIVQSFSIWILFIFFMFILWNFTREIWHYIIPALILSWFLVFILWKIFKK